METVNYGRNKFYDTGPWTTPGNYQLVVYYFQKRLELTRVGPITELHSKSRLLALPAKVRPRWKWLTSTNTLAYCNLELSFRDWKAAQIST